MDVTYTAYDETESIVWQKNEKADVKPAETVTLSFIADVKKYGLYTLKVQIKNSKLSFEKIVPFSFVNTDEEGRKNNLFGFNVHFDRDGYDAFEGCEVIEKSNAGFLRKSFYWSAIEQSKGSLFSRTRIKILSTLPENTTAQIQCLLSYGNKLYDMGHAQTIPHTDAQLSGFLNYCEFITRTLTEHGVGIQSYEVWNEPNLKTFNQSEESAATYALLVSETEKRLHRMNKNIEVGMLSLANIFAETTKAYAEEVFNSGLVDNVNSMTLHNYSYSSYPEDVSSERLLYYKNLYREKFNKEKAASYRMGIFSRCGIARTSTQGVYEIRVIFICWRKAASTFTYYDFANDGGIKTYMEHAHGAVQSQDARVTDTPYAAKESFVSLLI